MHTLVLRIAAAVTLAVPLAAQSLVADINTLTSAPGSAPGPMAQLGTTNTVVFAATVPGAPLDPQTVSWGLMAAAVATAASALAAGYAVGTVGTAAIGAFAEKPELMARLLIFVGLAEGIAIYGLIVSILILQRIG